MLLRQPVALQEVTGRRWPVDLEALVLGTVAFDEAESWNMAPT
jgi:hypothetical protein